MVSHTVSYTAFVELQTCTQTLVQIPDYIQIVGIILGMCTLGYLGDKIGRKWGSVFTASLMLIGAILLTATDAPTERGFVIFYIIAQVTIPSVLPLLSAPICLCVFQALCQGKSTVFLVACCFVTITFAPMLSGTEVTGTILGMHAKLPVHTYCTTATSAVSLHCITDCLVLLDVQFTFGYGVGGEYPMAAGSAAERAEAKGRASARKRGREVISLPHPQLTVSCVVCLPRCRCCIVPILIAFACALLMIACLCLLDLHWHYSAAPNSSLYTYSVDQ